MSGISTYAGCVYGMPLPAHPSLRLPGGRSPGPPVPEWPAVRQLGSAIL